MSSKLDYQIRLPPSMRLKDLMDKVVGQVQDSLLQAGLNWKPGTDMTLRELMEKVFSKHVVAFETCGCAGVCDEQVSPSSWNTSPASLLLSTTPADRDKVRRYHLRVFRRGLDAFGSSTARLILHTAGNAKETGARKALKGIREGLRYALGPYLFFSPLCGHMEICSSAKPVDPWSVD